MTAMASQVTITFAEYQEFKTAKSKAKAALINNDNDVSAQKIYASAVRQYNDAVNQVEQAKILRDIKRECKGYFRAKGADDEIPAIPTIQAYICSLAMLLGLAPWESPYHRFQRVMHKLKRITSDKAQWREISGHFWSVAEIAKSYYEPVHKISWATGSSTAALPGVLRLPAGPALAATGELLKLNYAPYCGELAQGIDERDGINHNKLSGMGFADFDVCMKYAWTNKKGFDPEQTVNDLLSTDGLEKTWDLPRLKINILRLLRSGEQRDRYPELKAHFKKMADAIDFKAVLVPGWQAKASLIGREYRGTIPPGSQQPLRPGTIVAVPRTGSPFPKFALVLMACTDEEDEEDVVYDLLVEPKGYTKEVPQSRITVIPDAELAQVAMANTPELQSVVESKLTAFTNKKTLLKLCELIDTIEPMPLTDQERKLLAKPAPLVWASINREGKYYNEGLEGEKTIKGPLKLGVDIQYAFVRKRDKPEISELLAKHSVTVLSFDAAFYILGKKKLAAQGVSV